MLQAMANDARHHALPLTQALIVILQEDEWILDAIDASFLCFFFLPCFASSLHLMGSS
jgi:hypothetical protein